MHTWSTWLSQFIALVFDFYIAAMHFRVFTSFATFALVGSALVAAAPISNVVAARTSGDSVTSTISRRDLPTLQGIIGNVSAIIDPLLTDLSM